MFTLKPFIPLREVLHSMDLNFNRANYPRFVTSPGWFLKPLPSLKSDKKININYLF